MVLKPAAGDKVNGGGDGAQRTREMRRRRRRSRNRATQQRRRIPPSRSDGNLAVDTTPRMLVQDIPRSPSRVGRRSGGRGSNPFPTMEQLRDGQSMPFMQEGGGQYVRAFNYQGKGEGRNCVIVTEKEQVSWLNWTAIPGQAGSYKFMLKPGGDNTKAFEAYEVGDLLGIKWKYSWNSPFRIHGANRVWFGLIKWVQNARGTIRATEQRYNTANVHFRSIKIRPPTNRYIAPQCMTSTGGGPQVGQPDDNYNISKVKFMDFEARSVGDDAIGLFHVKDAVLRKVSISNAFRAGVLLHSATLKTDKLAAVTLNGAPFVCDGTTKEAYCKDLTDSTSGVTVVDRSSRERGTRRKRVHSIVNARRRRHRARRHRRVTNDAAKESEHLYDGNACRIGGGGRGGGGGLNCAAFYGALCAAVTILLLMLMKLSLMLWRRRQQHGVSSGSPDLSRNEIKHDI